MNGNKSPPQTTQNVVTCTYCSLSFVDKIQLRGHCQTEAHQRVIMSDEGRDWFWRPPPRGLQADAYNLCENWTETNSCRFGIQCIDAHGPEELAEWRERFEYRRMKLQRAYEKELYGKSYTEELLEKWVESPNSEKIMKESLEYIKDKCDNDLATTVSSKHSEREWNFTFITDRQLCAIALLQDTHRNHFEVNSITVKNVDGKTENNFINLEVANKQEWVLKAGVNMNSANALIEYNVNVVFKTDIYGTFRQTVVFDFGSVPVLCRHLCVDVIPLGDVEKVCIIN